MSKFKNQSWITGVREALVDDPPSGWCVLTKIKGSGVYLLPKDLADNLANSSGYDQKLTGQYKIVSEFFLLNSSKKKGKISARVAGVQGSELFHEFRGVARSCGCPKPDKPKGEKATQSVARWPAKDNPPIVFQKDEYGKMAMWVKCMLEKPPTDLTWFLAAVRNYLNNS